MGDDATGLVAWSGRLELVDALWSLKSGRTVKFNIIQGEGVPKGVHPFAGFVKRRGNRVGTRFHMALVSPGFEQPAYDDQVMLKGGVNPLTGPMTLEFWIDEESEAHPLRGYSHRDGNVPGQEFAAVFVEFGNDGHPIDQTQRNLIESHHIRKDHSLSRFAAMLCENDLFVRFLSETVILDWDDKHQPVMGNMEYWWSFGRVTKWVREKCEVASRAEFDSDDEAALLFHSRVRQPYAAWCVANGYEDQR